MKLFRITPQNSIAAVWLALALITGLSVTLCRAQSIYSTNSESDKVNWRSLSFKANSFFGKVTTDVHLAALSAKAVTDLRIAGPQADALQPSGATIIYITVDSNINPLFGSKELLKTQSWCNPENAAALQRVRLRRGGKIWQKSYRFKHNGVYQMRKIPVDKKQRELPPEQWMTVEEEFVQFNGKDHRCPVVLEPSGLLYLVSRIELEEQKSPPMLCVFDRQQLHRVTVSAGGTRQLKVNYFERLQGKQIRRKGTIDAFRISFQPRPLVPNGQTPEAFSFLGLKGDFDIFIDKATRLPVQVSGKITGFGKVDIRLQQFSD